MADSHLRLLRAVARHWQLKVADLDADGPDDGSGGRRHDIEGTAARSRARVAAAEARRRRAPEA